MDIDSIVGLVMSIHPAIIVSVIVVLLACKGISAALPDHPVGKAAGAILQAALYPFNLILNGGGAVVKQISDSVAKRKENK